MKAMVVLAVVVCSAGLVRAGEKLPSEADVRKAIERGLPAVEKMGLDWIDKRDCMSCHTVTFMLWAHNEAAAHGIAVDQKKLDEWTLWSIDKSLGQRVFFKLSAGTIKSLPEPLQPKLSKLVNTTYTHEKDLVAALARALANDELKEHQKALVKNASTPGKEEKNDGGGLDTMAQLFLSRDHAAKEPRPGFYASTAELIMRMQDGAGTWRAGGQLPARRWPRSTADQTTTLWTILALESYSEPSSTVKTGLAKAHAAVKKPASDGNLEWVIVRMLYENKFGTPEASDGLKAQLLKRQNADGGWSALPEGKSEAFSTGQSLYALRVLGLAASDEILRRGQKYLLDSQDKDGSWSVFPGLTSNGTGDRLKRLEPIWRHWGSAWAVIGLAKSLPEK